MIKRLLTLFLVTAAFAKNDFGSVSFEECFTKSLYGKQQRTQMENVGKRLQDLLNNTETELNAADEKLNDEVYLEALTAGALKELKEKRVRLEEDLNRHRQQVGNTVRQLQQSAMRIVHNAASEASKELAKELSLDYVVSSDAMFFCNDALNITDKVISKMDEAFEIEKTRNEEQVKKDIKQLEAEQLDSAVEKLSSGKSSK